MKDEGCNLCGLSFGAHGSDPDAPCPIKELFELRDSGDDKFTDGVTVVGLRADGSAAIVSFTLTAARQLRDLLDIVPELGEEHEPESRGGPGRGF